MIYTLSLSSSPLPHFSLSFPLSLPSPNPSSTSSLHFLTPSFPPYPLLFPVQECTDNCCNANTCQLAAGAQCSAGACCNSTCQFRTYGTTCRTATGECDIAEYCSGDSGECPADDHRQYGTACASNTGYCYDGECPSHDAQCQFHYGSGALDHVEGLSSC